MLHTLKYLNVSNLLLQYWAKNARLILEQKIMNAVRSWVKKRNGRSEIDTRRVSKRSSIFNNYNTSICFTESLDRIQLKRNVSELKWNNFTFLVKDLENLVFLDYKGAINWMKNKDWLEIAE